MRWFFFCFLVLASCKPPSFEGRIETHYYPDKDGDGYGDVNGRGVILVDHFLSEAEMAEKKLRPVGKHTNGTFIRDEVDCDDTDHRVYPCSKSGDNCGFTPPCH